MSSNQRELPTYRIANYGMQPILYVWDMPAYLCRSEIISQLHRFTGIKSVRLVRQNLSEHCSRRDLAIEFISFAACLMPLRRIIWLRDVPYRMQTKWNGSEAHRQKEKQWQEAVLRAQIVVPQRRDCGGALRF